jgi:hypothetical protein
MLSLSIFFTIFILRVHHSTPELHHPMSETVRTLFLKRLPRVLFFRDMLNDYKIYETNQAFKDKCKLVLKSSESSIASLEQVRQKSLVLSQLGCAELSNLCPRNKKPPVKNYYGSNMLIVVEDSTTQPYCQSPESRRMIDPALAAKASRGPRKVNHLDSLIAENVEFLKSITDRIRKEYRIKNVSSDKITF